MQTKPLDCHDAETMDFDVESQIEQILRKSVHREMTHIRFDAVGGVVTLDGQVTSYHMKQLAQELVRRIPGVSRVVNLIRVDRPRG